MLCNWFTRPPDQLVFVEPFFLHRANPRLLRIQLEHFGMTVRDEDWSHTDATGQERFRRIMWPRLRGRKWGLKEVLCREHVQVVRELTPKCVLIMVRNIRDVALSFFEKHRLQNNLDRFSDEWVADYCVRESREILEFRNLLSTSGVPHMVLRYEDFTCSEQARAATANFIGWESGGQIHSHLAQFDREFEVERHGRTISQQLRRPHERSLSSAEAKLAVWIAKRCSEYQQEFSYS